MTHSAGVQCELKLGRSTADIMHKQDTQGAGVAEGGGRLRSGGWWLQVRTVCNMARSSGSWRSSSWCFFFRAGARGMLKVRWYCCCMAVLSPRVDLCAAIHHSTHKYSKCWRCQCVPPLAYVAPSKQAAALWCASFQLMLLKAAQSPTIERV